MKEKQISQDETSKERFKWHRLLGQLLAPMFQRWGYELQTEVDIPRKPKFVDIITTQIKSGVEHLNRLPKIYWKNTFDDLKPHNIISFKSYSESFSAQALIELFTYLNDYCAHKKIGFDQVNLYAITQHKPKKFLDPLKNSEVLEVIVEDQVYDYWFVKGEIKIRFLITGESDHPFLGLFSGKEELVNQCFEVIHHEPWLFDQVGYYLKQLSEYYGEEVYKMYTTEDWFRDHPKDEPHHFALPWDQEYHKKELLIQKESLKNQHKEELKKLERENKIKKLQEKIGDYEELYQEKSLSKEVYEEKVFLLQKQLQNLL